MQIIIETTQQHIKDTETESTSVYNSIVKCFQIQNITTSSLSANLYSFNKQLTIKIYRVVSAQNQNKRWCHHQKKQKMYHATTHWITALTLYPAVKKMTLF